MTGLRLTYPAYCVEFVVCRFVVSTAFAICIVSLYNS